MTRIPSGRLQIDAGVTWRNLVLRGIRRTAVRVLSFFCIGVWLNVSCISTRVHGEEPTPAPIEKPDTDDAAEHPLDVRVFLGVGDSATKVSIPEYGLLGQLLSLLKAAHLRRLDDDHLKMDKMYVEMHKSDGQPDYTIDLPSASFNTKTRIIVSIDPVKIKSHDFELEGERLKFNTYTREGELLGKVKMRIFNLKGVASPAEAAH